MDPERLRLQRERAQGAWELVVEESAQPGSRRMTILRRALQFKRSDEAQLAARLPGVVRRGAREDLLPLLARLERAGVPACLRPRA